MQDLNAISCSKTEPLKGSKEALLCDDESLNDIKHNTTAHKTPLKTAKLTHLNSLAGLIGDIDVNKEAYKLYNDSKHLL